MKEKAGVMKPPKHQTPNQVYIHVLMRDERRKKERSKQRQTNKVHVKVTALGMLCCFALFVCLTLLASFFLPSHLSLKHVYMHTVTRHYEGNLKQKHTIHVFAKSKEINPSCTCTCTCTVCNHTPPAGTLRLVRCK